MKLVTYSRSGRKSIGAVVADKVIDIAKAYKLMANEEGIPSDMKSFLQGGTVLLEKARQAVEFAAAGGRIQETELADVIFRIETVDIHAPISNPNKIICIGLNYRDHAAEVNLEIPTIPVLFSKYSNTINDPLSPIPKPEDSDQLDYEAELAVVIGKHASHVEEADANQYVAGYTAMNDVSVRDYQVRTSQWLQGKTFDGHAPMGPYLVTADEVNDPHRLAIKCYVNDEIRQNSNTKELIFSIPYLISYLSKIMVLEPGDIIATGTPHGVAMGLKPPKYLQVGDKVRVEIEGIGSLENPVVLGDKAFIQRQFLAKHQQGL
ncbi:FAA hydrolase family protein [Brevibacillus fluminis]|uniref:FAA hydrolase family protein n=1 Tax=Brevibacillus fluminis TaxID=511487 RepID=A0A3M8DBP5_9BACL|nr:fumarylacetoacetate hydrolase family protein [Brevibacillus fluminis]RNB85454.1 FAA hydrolase family protein [Brevibacillus fluminis]